MMFNSIVMVKQVPDTANISGQVMKEDGTVNRAKLPAIFNHEDRVALELALQVKDKYGGKVSVITMGPPRASDVLRECLYMGADDAYLISDRKFAGADTLATSYVLAEAIKKIGNQSADLSADKAGKAGYHFIFAGRQAIDGDTAQVGPQTADKLNIPQVTYVEEILDVKKSSVKVKKKIEGGFEILESSLPVLITVLKDAAFARPFKAKRVMAYKNSKTLLELEKITEGNSLLYIDQLKEEYISKGLYIHTLTFDDLKLEEKRCGVHGSPTKVYKVESVVLAGGKHESIEPNKAGVAYLVDKLLSDHILG
ncbi:MAG: electron transfer flavoprotein subunit beta/FixA family protein [Ignavibacteria bacterium]